MFSRHNSSEPALHINEIDVNDKYKFLKKIGQGSYGEVWLVLPKRKSTQKPSTKEHVLKRLDLRQSAIAPSQNDIESAEREAKLLSTLKHPNIVAYTESFRSKDGFLNIVMAYCEGGDLYTRLKEKKSKRELLSEDQIIEWFIQICMALQYIHEKNILHRDLKTQNIFLTKSEIVKVGDLGIARVLKSGNDFATTIIGTPYYMSPEIFSQRPYGKKSDIWSLGCCVYEMTSLQHAFNAKDMDSLVRKIIRGQAPQLSKGYSKELGGILAMMLKKEPKDRPTAKAILQDAYIKQHILRLLEKAQAQCQNQANSKSQPIINVSPVSSPSRSNSASNSRATSATNSPPSRPTSASKPYATNSSSPRPMSPSNSSPSKSRLLDHSNPAILPSIPALPSSVHSRSPSSHDINRSTPVAAPLPSNEPKVSESRARRRRDIQACRSNPLPMNHQLKDLEFLSNLSQNDTLHRFKRDQQLKKSLKQCQQRSSSDEQETSPIRPSDEKISQPVIVQKPTRTASMESNINSSKPPSYPIVTNSYDYPQGSKSCSARQRRRENKSQTSSSEYLTPNESPNQTAINNNQLLPSVSQENLKEIEQKKEGERDMNDFMLMLTATLRLPNHDALRSDELTDSESTLIEEEEDSPMRAWTSGERTIAAPLHETNLLHQRCQSIREQCLREITPDRLKRVLQMLDNVSEAQITEEMIRVLGRDLYDKYSGQIFALKFYEDNLSTRS